MEIIEKKIMQKRKSMMLKINIWLSHGVQVTAQSGKCQSTCNCSGIAIFLFVCFTDDATNSYSYVYTVKIMGFGDNCVPQ